MAIETERKYVNVPLEDVVTRLLAAGARPGPRHLETNVLYDTARGGLRKSGRLLRLRKQEWHDGVRYFLTFKAPVAGEKSSLLTVKAREEFETEIADGKVMARILEECGYPAVARYQKVRQSWDFYLQPGYGSPVINNHKMMVEVSIDELPFCTAIELEGAEDLLDCAEKALGLDKSAMSTKSYHALHQEWLAANGLAGENDFVFSPRMEILVRRNLGLDS